MNRLVWIGCAALLALAATGSHVGAACCYFSAKNADILQPAQKVFITWDANKQMETFTVQPRFEGNALDFGMVIPTPTQPKLHEMPRDFFKELAVYTIMKNRAFPRSKLLPMPPTKGGFGGGKKMSKGAPQSAKKDGGEVRPPAIKILETGLVGSLEYKIIEAGRSDDLFQWLKDHKYNYAGDEATLNFYIQKKWIFTVMKIDTMQMKRNKDGSFTGDVTPTRFQFASDKLIYPLKITQLSVKDKTEALFYVQSSTKIDLPGDMTYQYQWVPMLQTARGSKTFGKGISKTRQLFGRQAEWLDAIQEQIPGLLQKGRDLGYTFQPGRRPTPNSKGHIATTMEWAKKLTAEDIKVLQGDAPYSEKVPNVDEGFTQADIADPKKREAIYKVIRDRLERARKDRPNGYLVREAPVEDLRQLRILVGHLQSGGFITKFRKIFCKDEMNDDLLLVEARLGQNTDDSEYEEILPSSPP
jgi:hypothetical protein